MLDQSLFYLMEGFIDQGTGKEPLHHGIYRCHHRTGQCSLSCQLNLLSVAYGALVYQ